MIHQILFLANEGPRENPWAFAFLSAIWSQICLRFEGFLAYAPLFVIFVLWAANFVVGSMVAVRNSWRTWKGYATKKERKDCWSFDKCVNGIARFIAWGMLHAGTFVIRAQGLGVISGFVEFAASLAEGSKLLRNCGILTGAGWAVAFADVAETAADRLPLVAQVRLDEALPEPQMNGRYHGSPHIPADQPEPLKDEDNQHG